MEKPIVSNVARPRTSASVKDYVGIILRRRWIIILSLLSVASSTVFFVLRIPDIYESFSTVVIEQQNMVLNQAMNVGTEGRSLDFYQGILNSRTFLEMVYDSVGLDMIKAARPKIDRDGALAYIQSCISLRNTEYASFIRFYVQALRARGRRFSAGGAVKSRPRSRDAPRPNSTTSSKPSGTSSNRPNMIIRPTGN